jgi:hypothetical protein
MYDESTKTLTVRRPNGQTYKHQSYMLPGGGNKVFGVVTVGQEVHVLVGPNNNSRPNTRIKFDQSATYKGSSGI